VAPPPWHSRKCPLIVDDDVVDDPAGVVGSLPTCPVPGHRQAVTRDEVIHDAWLGTPTRGRMDADTSKRPIDCASLPLRRTRRRVVHGTALSLYAPPPRSDPKRDGARSIRFFAYPNSFSFSSARGN